nr:cytochrome c-type biogenesis protein [uncultured Dongia sp.]
MRHWPQKALLALLLLCLLSGANLVLPSYALAQAELPDVPLADTALEARARKLMKDVRCVVCQAQSIDESDAGIANDMRRLIRSEIASGKSDDEIRHYLAARYGDFVLFKPPFKASTALLWAGPFLLLGLGAVIMVMFFRKRTTTLAPGSLSAEEMRRVEAALQEGPLQEPPLQQTGEPATRPDHGSGA